MSDYPGYTSPNAPQSGPTPPPSGPEFPPPHEGEMQPPPPPPGKQRNTVGLIALITALVGFLFACIPGALIVGWILLPIAFVLSIVGLALSGKPKGTSIAAIIVSIVGFIVGVLVFFFVVESAIDEAFGGSESEIIAPDEEDEVAAGEELDDGAEEDGAEDDGAEEDGAEEDGTDEDVTEEDGAGEEEVAEGEEGSRTNPIALGSTIRAGEWDVTVIGFERDATDEVLAANPFNDEPEEGHSYALVEAEATYTGDESGLPWLEISFAYVSESGNTSDTYDAEAVGPSPDFDEIGELYEGASGSGYIVLEVPDDDAGLLRVSPGMFGDDVFVATE